MIYKTLHEDTDFEKIPDDWHKWIIKPIHMGRSMYNYRGITLTSNVYNVYAKIIEQSVELLVYGRQWYLRWGSGGFQMGQTDGGQHFYSTGDMYT